MKRLILAAAVLFVFVTPLTAQDEDVVLPDRVMRQVVRRVVTWYFKPRRVQKSVYVSDRMIKESWLPKIKGIDFVLVTDEEMKSRETGVFFFRSVEKDGRYFHVSFGYGYPDVGISGCDATGDIWTLSTESERVRLWKNYGEGWGAACSDVA